MVQSHQRCWEDLHAASAQITCEAGIGGEDCRVIRVFCSCRNTYRLLCEKYARSRGPQQDLSNSDCCSIRDVACSLFGDRGSQYVVARACRGVSIGGEGSGRSAELHLQQARRVATFESVVSGVRIAGLKDLRVSAQ